MSFRAAVYKIMKKSENGLKAADGKKRGAVMIKPGRYRHFKGREYEVIGVAKHSETLEEMVVYRQLYGEHGLWVRPASMWEETVERDGKTYKRFTYIGDEE